MDDIFNIIILLVFFLLPVLSAVVKAIKGRDKKARDGTGLRKAATPPPDQPKANEPTPAEEMAVWLRSDRAGARPEISAPRRKPVSVRPDFTGREESGIIPVAVLEPAPHPVKTFPHAAAAQHHETIAEHVESRHFESLSDAVKADMEDHARADIEERVRKDLEEEKWERRRERFEFQDGVGIDEERTQAETPLTGGGSDWTLNELRRAVLMSEILAPPLALRAPGEGPLEPRLEP